MWWGDVFKALQVVAAAALWRSTMKPSGALAGCIVPAVAQTTTYYIVRKPTTRHCRIISQRPVSHTETIVGPNGVVYKTRTEATNAMRAVKVCHED